MPAEFPRGLKSDEIIKAFERAGGIQRAGKGSHCNIKMPTGQVVTIPGHREVKIGLLRAAVKKAGLSVEEFVRLLGR